MKMRPFSCIILCLLVLSSFHLLSTTITLASAASAASAASSSSIVLFKGKETRRELISSNHHRAETHQIQVVDTRSDIKGAAREDDNGDDNEDELVYHVDYHGVSTHPNPTPKHPGP